MQNLLTSLLVTIIHLFFDVCPCRYYLPRKLPSYLRLFKKIFGGLLEALGIIAENSCLTSGFIKKLTHLRNFNPDEVLDFAWSYT